MTIDNDFNRLQYDANIKEYLNTNLDQHIGGGDVTGRVRLVQEYLPVGSSVFEIGGGGGDDAIALSKGGYIVTTSDFSEKFVEAMQSKGLSAIQFDAKQDDLPESYNALYANAVFVHFSVEELSNFLTRAIDKLQSPKLIFLSIIEGRSQERRSGKNVSFERDFQDYSQEMLRTTLERTGFSIQHIELVDERWLQIIASAND